MKENSLARDSASDDEDLRGRDELTSSSPDKPLSDPDAYIQWFYVGFVLTGQDIHLSAFMPPIMPIAVPGTTLYQSLLAVALMKFGKVKEDAGTILEGRRLYSSSLMRLHQDLADMNRSQDDQTLACATILGVFEVFRDAPRSS